MGRVWFLPSFARRKIKGLEMFGKVEKPNERKVCSECGAFIMGDRFVLEVKMGGKPTETQSDLCKPCYNKLKSNETI